MFEEFDGLEDDVGEDEQDDDGSIYTYSYGGGSVDTEEPSSDSESVDTIEETQDFEEEKGQCLFSSLVKGS